MADRSVFDGRTLMLYRSDNSIAGAWPAISGRSGHQKPSEQNVPFQGPLTEGRYSFSTGDIQPLTTLDAMMGLVGRGPFPGSIAAWGTERVPLVSEAVPANGRNHFFIHGGVTPGSAGCIDLGPNEKAYFDALRSTGESTHNVIVQYDSSLETSAHPLADSSVWNGAQQYYTRPLPGLLSPFAQKAVPAMPAFQPPARYPARADLGTSGGASTGSERDPMVTYRDKPSPSIFDGGASPVPFPLEALLSRDRNRTLAEWKSSTLGQAALPAPVLPRSAGIGADLVPPTDSNFTGGRPGRIAALAGIDLQNPNQSALSPLDEQLRDYFRDDSLQPWLAQGRR